MSTMNSPASVSDLHARSKQAASLEEFGLSLRRVCIALASVDVWELELGAAIDAPLAHNVLSNAEHDRALRFRRDHDRRRFIAAHVALRVLLAQYLAVTPAAISFSYGERGKPSLAYPRTLHFNMSHTQRLALFAFSHAMPVGIDAEDLDRKVDPLPLARRLFTAPELAAFEQLAPDQRARGFLRCWTRKEAIAKAVGSGLALPFAKIDAGIDEDNGRVFRRFVDQGTTPASLDLYSIAATGYTATVATLVDDNRQ